MEYDDIQIRITEQGRSIADILLFIDNAAPPPSRALKWS